MGTQLHEGHSTVRTPRSKMSIEKFPIAKIQRLPDLGILNIADWDEFLSQSDVFFREHMETPLTHKETLSDFQQMKLLGTGSFGDVVLIQHKQTEKYFAMKALSKEKLVRGKQVDHTRQEKMILQSINFPMTVYLTYFFKDNSFIYLVMPFVAGGELFSFLRKMRRLEEVQARFYISQVVLALEYLHYLDLVYRDLKPENILIDENGYLKLTDFGFCKRLTRSRTYTMCGTPEYIAPEVILSRGYSKPVDWWALGILIYEMCVGNPPFFSQNPMKLYEKVLAQRYKMPSFFSNDLKDLVKNLLQADLTKRFGNMKNGIDDIKKHKWFKAVNWLTILNRRARPFYTPNINGPGDTDHFDHYKWTPPSIAGEDKYVSDFEGF